LAPLTELTRAAGTTLFTTLMAACQLLFSRYAGQRDIALGTVVSGRNRAELERIVGFFVNTLVLRTQVDEALTFLEFLSAVNDVALDAFAHDEVPFERLVDTVHAQRDISRNPLFDIMVVLQDAKRKPSGFAGLTVADVNVPRSSAIFDLVVNFEDGYNELTGFVEYSTELFDAVTIERMVGHLQLLLERITENPHQLLAELTLLSEVEHNQIVHEFNDTLREIPPLHCRTCSRHRPLGRRMRRQ
jgi:non-ribosomal peptide synthetase component F